MKIIILSFLAVLYCSATNALQWQGHWKSTFGEMNLIEKQTGYKNTSLIFGNYDKNGYIIGVSVENKIYGVFYDNKLLQKGSYVFTLGESKKDFKGLWSFDDINKELKWNGSRAVNPKLKKIKGVDRYRYMEGQWDTNFGELELTQEGVFIEGKYDSKGKLYAVFNHQTNTVFGLFTNKKRYGLLKFQLNENRDSFKGLWSWETNKWAKQKWDGKKVQK